MNDWLESFGRRVAELRERAGMTQEQLAEALPLGARSLQRIEQGRSNISVLSLVRLAEVLGVHPGELFEPTTHKRRPGRPRKRPTAKGKRPAAKRPRKR